MSCSLYYNLAEYKSRSRVCYEIVMLAVTYIVIRIFRSFSLVTPYHINNTHFQIILIIFFSFRGLFYINPTKLPAKRWRCVCYFFFFFCCSCRFVHYIHCIHAIELGEKRLPSGCLKSIFIFMFSIFFVENSVRERWSMCLCIWLKRDEMMNECEWCAFELWSVQWSVVCRCCV